MRQSAAFIHSRVITVDPLTDTECMKLRSKPTLRTTINKSIIIKMVKAKKRETMKRFHAVYVDISFAAVAM